MPVSRLHEDRAAISPKPTKRDVAVLLAFIALIGFAGRLAPNHPSPVNHADNHSACDR